MKVYMYTLYIFIRWHQVIIIVEILFNTDKKKKYLTTEIRISYVYRKIKYNFRNYGSTEPEGVPMAILKCSSLKKTN